MAIFTKRIYLNMLAGLAGGLAEIIWIGLYSTMSQTDGHEVSRQITASVVPGWASSALAPALGVAIHLVLSVVLALYCCKVFIEPAARRLGRSVIFPGSLIILACIWAINFLVILPVINPAFITLLPFLVTLVSKMLFGCAMGTVLIYGFSRAPI